MKRTTSIIAAGASALALGCVLREPDIEMSADNMRVRESAHADWDTSYDVVRDKAATRAEPGRQGN